MADPGLKLYVLSFVSVAETSSNTGPPRTQTNLTSSAVLPVNYCRHRLSFQCFNHLCSRTPSLPSTSYQICIITFASTNAAVLNFLNIEVDLKQTELFARLSRTSWNMKPKSRSVKLYIQIKFGSVLLVFHRLEHFRNWVATAIEVPATTCVQLPTVNAKQAMQLM